MLQSKSPCRQTIETAAALFVKTSGGLVFEASAKDLQALPDVNAQQAQAIIAGRPYENTSQLVKKQIMSQSQYNKLRSQMIVK